MSDRFSEFGALNRIGDRLSELESGGGPGRPRWPRWLAGLLAVGAVGVVLSPAGAEVREVVGLEDGDRDCLAPEFGTLARGDVASRREALRGAGAASPYDPGDCTEVLSFEELEELMPTVEGRLQQGPIGNDTELPATEEALERVVRDALERAAELDRAPAPEELRGPADP